MVRLRSHNSELVFITETYQNNEIRYARHQIFFGFITPNWMQYGCTYRFT